jgi:hypothetical protein
MKKKILISSLILILIIIVLISVDKFRGAGHLEYNIPSNGIVPDEKTAIKIAEAISLPIFGENIKDYKPFHAELRSDSIWHVYGFPKESFNTIQLGGAPEFDIQKKDGKILNVILSR